MRECHFPTCEFPILLLLGSCSNLLINMCMLKYKRKTISIYPCIANKLITIFFLFAESTSRCLLVALSLHASHGLVVTRTNKLQTYLSFDFPKIRKFEPFGRTGATGRIRSSLTQRPSALIISLSVIMMHHISSSEL